MESKKEFDEWELKQKEKLEILLECQESRGVDSCMKCQKILECDIRKEYVNAVYESMNKGTGGGFEF